MLTWIRHQFGGKKKNAIGTTTVSPSEEQESPRQKAELYKKKGNQFLAKGDVKNAEVCYRQAILADASYAEAYNNLGIVLQQQSNLSEAQRVLEQALQLDPTLVNAHYNLGLILKENQLWPNAIDYFKAALALQPDFENASLDLALLYFDLGDINSSRQVILDGLSRNPSASNLHIYLGNVHKSVGEIEVAIACYRDAVMHAPGNVSAHYQLGCALQEQNHVDDAIPSFQKALDLQGDFAEGHYQLGLAYLSLNKNDLAQNSFQHAISSRQDYAEAYYALGSVLQTQKKIEQAIICLRQAILIKPDLVDAYINLGTAQKLLGSYDDAIGNYKKAIAIKPDIAAGHYNLGLLFLELGRFDESIASSRLSILHHPDFADGHTNLGLALKDQGKTNEALDSFRKVVALRPDFAAGYSNLLFAMQYVADLTPMEIFNEHRNYAERFEAPIKHQWLAHQNSRDPERRLKVGYVSGDFRNHAVSFFIAPIFANHDKSQVEVFCYYNHIVHDQYTDQIASAADHWHVCAGMSDDELAARIRADGIDILVDLSGHTAFNRLPVFARKPAPVQVTWIGYQATTGLTAMDYRITDESMDPVGMTEQYHSETLVRIPSSGQFQPVPDCPPINALPALSSKKFIFACLNNLAKINQGVIHLWAHILQVLPHAQLMLGNISGPETEQGLIDMFLLEGISAERLIFKEKMSLADYLALHQEIDLALDTFPYNGGTTTFHALWMGIPVLALAGNTPVSRAGVAIMAGAGLPQFATASPDEYVARAIEFSQDLMGLNAIRLSLREKMTPLFGSDPLYLTRPLEMMYRTIWAKWCDG